MRCVKNQMACIIFKSDLYFVYVRLHLAITLLVMSSLVSGVFNFFLLRHGLGVIYDKNWYYNIYQPNLQRT